MSDRALPHTVEAITFYVRPGSAAEHGAHAFNQILSRLTQDRASGDGEQHDIEVLLRDH